MAGIHETYDTAEDGAPLTWDYWAATGTPKAIIILVHGGGFRAGSRHNCDQIIPDLVAAGYDCVTTDYRLAPPGSIPGQTTSGRYPRQVDDTKRAVIAVRADARFTGLPIFGIGASAGGSHLGMCLNDETVQASPIAWDTSKRIAALVTLSGVMDFDDRTPFPNSDQDWFLIRNYLGILPAGDPDSPADLAQCAAASPYAFVNANSRPLMMFNSTNDSVPSVPHATTITQAYIDAGVAEHSAFIPDMGGAFAHAFDYWALIKNQVIAWFDAQVSGDPPPPPDPGPREIVRGVSVGTTSGQPIDQSTLADPNVDSIGLNVHWNHLEPTEGNLDTAYLEAEIPRIAAAGKKCILRVTTMGGSDNFGGNTPNWVFTAMGAPAGPGDRTIRHDCTTTSGDPTVTSPTADFTSRDLHASIVGDGMPGAPTYIGVINSPTSIELSSSPTTHVPVNATSSHPGDASLVMGRERVSSSTHEVVWGVNYDYIDPNPQHQGDPQTTIPVFWDPVYGAKKKAMLNALGDWITNTTDLTQVERECVKIIGIAWANAQTEDFNIPSDDTIDPGETLTRREKWQNSPTDPNVDLRGAGYTTQKMLDTAVNRISNDGFTDGVTATSTSFVSATANFTYADVGKQISSAGNITSGTTIAAWVSRTEVTLSAATLTTGTGRQFQIHQRDTGFFDVAIAAFPGQLVTSALAGNDSALDAEAADEAGDPEPKLYQAKTVYAILASKYPGFCIAQRNGVAANMGDAPGNGVMRLLWDIRQAGGFIGGQDLWFCFEDPNYRMNGGTNEDHQNPGVFLTDEQICNRAGSKLFGYGASYREMYPRDAINLPLAIKFSHDLFTGGSEPPPPPPPTTKLSAALTIDDVNYAEEIIFEICDLLNIAIPEGLSSISKEMLATMARKINKHVDYAWRLFHWPEFQVLEERPFARIWDRVSNPLSQGELVFDVGYLDPETGEWLGLGYFNVFGNTNDGLTAIPYTLLSSDYVIPLLQQCRRRIGDMTAVFPNDPRPAGIIAPIMKTNFRISGRGLEVAGSGAGVNGTVFISYQAVPYKYAGEVFNLQATTYKAGSLILSKTGLTYRAVVDTPAGIPLTDPRWAYVPFPRVLAQFVIYSAAADLEDDVTLANQWRALGVEYLGRQIDIKADQLPPDQYDYSPRRTVWPEGCSGFLWSAYPPFTAPDLSAGDETTIDATCVNEWGDIIPD